MIGIDRVCLVVTFPRERLRLHSKCCFDRANYDRCFAALCARPRYSLDHGPLLSCLACQRSGDCYFSSALLLGRNRQRFDSDVVQDSNPCLEGIGADRLRVCVAGPERLEPVSPLSSCVGLGIDRLTVFNLRLVNRAFSEKLAPATGRSFMAGILDCDRQPFALRAAD